MDAQPLTEAKIGTSTDPKVDEYTLIKEVQIMSTMPEEVIVAREGAAKVKLLANKLQEIHVGVTRSVDDVPKVVTSVVDRHIHGARVLPEAMYVGI